MKRTDDQADEFQRSEKVVLSDAAVVCVEMNDAFLVDITVLCVYAVEMCGSA